MSEICDGDGSWLVDKTVKRSVNNYINKLLKVDESSDPNVRHYRFEYINFDTISELKKKLNELNAKSYIECETTIHTPDNAWEYVCICKVWDSLNGPYDYFLPKKRKKLKKKRKTK